MAEWIKLQEKIIRDPVVIDQSERLNLDPRIIAWSWVTLWDWAREQTEDGFVARMTPTRIDGIVNIKGFSEHAGEWLAWRDGGVVFPKWDTHNSKGAKERAVNARRNKKHRAKSLRDGSVTVPPSRDRCTDDDTRDASVTVRPSPEEKRREENKETPKPPEGEPAGFIAFWQAWPSHDRKVDRKGCLRHWRKHELEPLTATIVADVNRRKQSHDWTKDAGKYIPAPKVYLNQQRWEAVVGQMAGKRAMGVD